jgi:tetratricopeptide (TPR) repeat protein
MKRSLGLTLGVALLCATVTRADDAPKPDRPAIASKTPKKVVRDCALSVWGCSSRAGASESQLYDQLIHSARSQLLFGQTAPGADLSQTIADLQDATQTFPEQSEAWLLLAVIYAEQGACAVGLSLMERMLSVPPSSPIEHRWRDKQALQLGLALCQTRRGEPDLAIAQYRRMLLSDGPSHRVLYRLGDALMAQGRLDEAIPHYSQACLDLPTLQPLVNVSRSCAGLLAALDRSRRQRPLKLMTQLRRSDMGLRFLKMSDFVPTADRDYYEALLHPPSCDRISFLTSYLQTAAATTPRAHLRRAEELLAETKSQVPGCSPSTSATSSPVLKDTPQVADSPGLPTDGL